MAKKIACLMLTMGLLVGCATDRGRTQAEGTAVGGGVGAGVGAGLGYVIGGKDGAKLGAVAGGLTGALLGFLVATHVADQKEKYAKTEDYLEAVIANAKEVNEKTRVYNETLSAEINQLNIKTASLVSQYNQRKASKSQLTKQAKVLQDKIEDAEKNLKVVKYEIEKQNEVLVNERQAGGVASDNYRFGVMQSQINELERNKVELERDIVKLAAIKNRVSV